MTAITLAKVFYKCIQRNPKDGPLYLPTDEWITIHDELTAMKLKQDDDVPLCADSGYMNILIGGIEVRPK